MAIRFTRTSTQYLSRTSGTILNWNAPFTIMGWFYIVSTPGSGLYNNFFSATGPSGTYGSQTYEMTNDLWIIGSSPGSLLSVTTWYHIAIVRTAVDVAYGYLNGNQDIINNGDVSSQAACTSMYVGTWAGGSDLGDERVFAIKAWSAGLTQAEVQQEMYVIAPRRTANLYGFWPCFPGSGERAKDYSGNGYNWTEVNTPTDEAERAVSWGASPKLWTPAAGEEPAAVVLQRLLDRGYGRGFERGFMKGVL